MALPGLVEASKFPGDIKEQTGVGLLQFYQALIGHDACLPIGTMVGLLTMINNNSTKLSV
jgi:hypothetical protein